LIPLPLLVLPPNRSEIKLNILFEKRKKLQASLTGEEEEERRGKIEG